MSRFFGTARIEMSNAKTLLEFLRESHLGKRLALVNAAGGSNTAVCSHVGKEAKRAQQPKQQFKMRIRQ